jgi:very-short-patch-repair endonuclease
LTLVRPGHTIDDMRDVPGQAVKHARQLRRTQTDAERVLWARLRSRQLHGVKFRRQQPLGPYVADFCSHEAQLVIELDGSQHAEQVAADEQRTNYIQSRGFRVLRFWNDQVLINPKGVLETIAAALPSTLRKED